MLGMKGWKRAALFIGIMGLASCPARADTFELRSLRVDAIRFFDGGHDPLLTESGQEGRGLGAQLDLHMDVDVFRYFFWNSTVHSLADRRIFAGDEAGQFRLINLQMQFGLRLFSVLDIYYWHSSAHLLDTTYTAGHWPVQDGVGITLKIYESPAPPESLLP
jgi:hypothetical protein